MRILVLSVLLMLLQAAPLHAKELSITAYITFYTYYDNTPPRSAEIAYHLFHKKAGGNCTWNNPTTIAVGYVMRQDSFVLDWPFKVGMKLYIPSLQCYGIVEDLCGDPPHPERGPCHHNRDHPGLTQIDVWLGGKGENKNAVLECMLRLTDSKGYRHQVLLNPKAGYATIQGPLFKNGRCRKQIDEK
jgi:hypothetical protein